MITNTSFYTHIYTLNKYCWKKVLCKECVSDWLIWKKTSIFTRIFVSIMVFVTYTNSELGSVFKLPYIDV